MEEAVDISYYVGKQASESLGILDIPLNNGQIVSINLVDELPEDPNELISFLTTENCPGKYWVSVAMAYSQANMLDESYSVLKTALDLPHFKHDDKITFRSSLGWLYLKYVSIGREKDKNLQNATKEINDLSNTDSSKGNVSYLLAKAILSLYNDEVDQALDIFDKLLKLNNNNSFALLGKGQIIMSKTKNYANALKLFQQVLILNPLMKPDPRIGIGLCFWFLKDEKMAVKSWERALEIDPHNIKARILLNLALFNSTFNSSLSDAEFQSQYKECLIEASKNHKDDTKDSSTLLALASYYFSNGDYAIVETIATNLILKLSGDQNTTKLYGSSKLSKFQSNTLSLAAFWLGRVSFAKSDFTQAQKYFHESIKLNENNLLAKLGLGQAQANRGSNEEAIITFESVLKTNPKCPEINYALGLLYSQHKSKRKQEQAIQLLESYLRLCNNKTVGDVKNDDESIEFLNKEPIILNAFLVLSKLHETKDINQSLNYLTKAIASRKEVGQNVPLEIYCNIGVFNFLKNNFQVAAENFQTALDILKSSDGFKDEEGDVLIDLPQDLNITLSFNLARSIEITDQSSAIETYEKLLEECPHYFSAKLRLLFLDCVSTNKSTKAQIKDEIEQLLQLNASNPEIRSFYGWFAKTIGKKVGIKPDADTQHQKDTLVEYDSHDCYALLSLANIYCVMARDIKGSSQDDKKKKYYIRAIELFSKVLSVDPKNVFGAQGLAIVYIENKESHKGLEILRKIRDSLNDISVYLNLGHALLELKQYAKSIEHYEIALVRYADGNDSKILSFLGRAWYLRGLAEKNLSFLVNSLSYCEEALEKSTGAKSSLRFNIAFVQFQMADLISKLPVEQRSLDEIKSSIDRLQEAIDSLSSLASEEEKYPPYPKEELKARANMGSNTLLKKLNACYNETVENIENTEKRFEEAKKLREEEDALRLKQEEEKRMEEKAREAELSRERAKLQEQAQQWAEEARMNVVEDEDDDKLFNEESAAKESKKRSRAGTGKKGKNKGGKKKNVIDDSDNDSASPSDNELEPENDAKTQDNGDDEGEIKTKKRKVNALSKEVIEDSDEELEDEFFN